MDDMDIAFGAFFANIFGSLLTWVGHHGAKVFLIVAAAATAGFLIRSALSRRKIMPMLDNITGSSYKGILKSEVFLSGAQKQRIATIIKTSNNALQSLVWIVAAIMILPEFGINVAPILASLGLVGLAVGMAAKDILTDFIAGVFIIFEGGYNIGDEVEIAGFSGKVLEISLRRTILQNDDGVICAVPNREVKSIKKLRGRKKEVEKESRIKLIIK
jgi:small conductance mechanosensitive channel